MNQVMSIRIDQDVKAAATEVAESVGLKLSTLINAYLRQVALTRRIELYAPEEMTPHLEHLLEKVEEEIKTGKVSDQFHSTKDLLANLRAQ